MRLLRTVAITAMALAQSAAAQTLPYGTYYCAMSSGGMLAHMGDIEIRDGYFRGPAFDGAWGDWYRMKVTRAGTIRWGGPLGGFESDASTVVSTQIKRDGPNPAFGILLQTANGTFLSVSCVPQ
jgi:hypothetical protein